MHTLKLTTQQLTLVLSALEAVTPSGGGSPVYSLTGKISQETGVNPDQGQVAHFAANAIRDYLELVDNQAAQEIRAQLEIDLALEINPAR